MSGSEWWRGAVIYQIYPRSFMDSNGDGIGDIPGITDKLDHIASLGVDAIWLSPFFKSPMKDYGYDVSDYKDVAPMFGTLDDFKAMLNKAHNLGLKVIIDFVLTHSSDQHEWFQESRKDRDNDKADWYIWADPKPDGSPPNNWQAHFGGSSWTYDIRRGQYYFHNFLPEQPDINLRNPDVQNALFDVARFWLDMGVDGFRLDAARHYFCDPLMKDNPPNPNPTSVWFDHPTPFTMQLHENDIHIPDTIRFMEKLRAVIDEYDDRMTVAEIGGENALALLAQYTDNSKKRCHTAYSFNMASGDALTIDKIKSNIEGFLEQPEQGWPAWTFSNHDVVRAASRWHPNKDGWHYDHHLSKMMITLLGSLYGTVFIYQGEELGLPESEVPFEKIQDPMGKYLYPAWQGRDGARTPIPWYGDKPYGGFSTVEPWLPVNETHQSLAVDLQEDDQDSPLHFTREYLAWRKTVPALINGDITFIDTANDNVMAFTRQRGEDKILCAFNLSPAEQKIELPQTCKGETPAFATGNANIETAGTGVPVLTLTGYQAIFI